MLDNTNKLLTNQSTSKHLKRTKENFDLTINKRLSVCLHSNKQIKH